MVQLVPFFLAFLRHDQALLVRAASTDRRAQRREGHIIRVIWLEIFFHFYKHITSSSLLFKSKSKFLQHQHCTGPALALRHHHIPTRN